MKLIDLKGQKFGRLTVIERVENCKSGAQWRCLCECGKQTKTSACNLKTGEVKSCGCLNTKHGLRYTSLYRIWEGMRRRCNNPNMTGYKYYGGRGINVCIEWANNPKAFFDWALSNGYQKGLSIDRIDVNGDYEPSNCRWATPKEQANNRRNTPYITCDGTIKTQREWDSFFGLNPGTINRRLHKGKTEADALQGKLPNAKARFITYNGMTKNIMQWADYLGIKYCTLVGRLTTRKWPVEKAFSTPLNGRV